MATGSVRERLQGARRRRQVGCRGRQAHLGDARRGLALAYAWSGRQDEAIELLDRLRGEDRAVADEKLRAVRATAKIAALQGWLDAVRLAAERRVQ